MKPLQIRAVKSSYRPGYPRFTEVENWEDLVASGRRQLFHPATLIFAGLLGGAMLMQAGAQEPEQKPIEPMKVPNPEAQKVVDAALKDLNDGWCRESSTQKVENPQTGNPPVIIPRIRISFGNSYTGVFNVMEAKQATLKLFAAYGVRLEENFPYKKDGIEFQLDGYDPKKHIGFEIVGSENPPRGFDAAQPPDKTDPAIKLEESEVKLLESDIKTGKETLFLAPVEKYPKMDGDQYTPLRAYLQSVVDYLEWLKAEGRL